MKFFAVCLAQEFTQILFYSTKNKIFNENGQLVEEKGGGDGQQQNFQLFKSFCYPLVSKFMRCLSKKNYNKKIKYWHQSTGLGMGNDQTKHPASGLKRKPWLIGLK